MGTTTNKRKADDISKEKEEEELKNKDVVVQVAEEVAAAAAAAAADADAPLLDADDATGDEDKGDDDKGDDDKDDEDGAGSASKRRFFPRVKHLLTAEWEPVSLLLSVALVGVCPVTVLKNPNLRAICSFSELEVSIRSTGRSR